MLISSEFGAESCSVYFYSCISALIYVDFVIDFVK